MIPQTFNLLSACRTCSPELFEKHFLFAGSTCSLVLPDSTAHDAGKNLTDAAFQANADMLHILTKSIAVETANRMTVMEQYHALICLALSIIRKEAAV